MYPIHTPDLGTLGTDTCTDCRAAEAEDVILYVDALDATFFPCHLDLLAEFRAFQADIVFQADDFDWRAPRAAWQPPCACLLARCPCSRGPPVRCAQHTHHVRAPEPEQELKSPDVCMRLGRPNVEDDIKNDLFPDPPSGAHPKFRCDTLGTALACVWRNWCVWLVLPAAVHTVWSLSVVLCKRPVACCAVRAPPSSAAVWAGCCARACGWAARARCGTTCRATSWLRGMWMSARGTIRGARSCPLGMLASLAAGACLAPQLDKGGERGRCACARQVVAQPVPGTGVCAGRGGAPGPAAGYRLPRPPVPGAAGSLPRLPGGCAGSLGLTLLAGASQAILT